MQWVGLLIDLAIVIGLGRAILRGSQVGFFRVVFDIIGLVLAVALAVLIYRYGGTLLVKHFHFPPLVVALAIFTIVWLGTELLYLYVMRHKVRVSSLTSHDGLFSATGLTAAILSCLYYFFLVAIGVMFLVGLPLPARVKAAVNSSKIANFIVLSGSPWQNQINTVVNKNISQALSFLTVETKTEDETIQLGFKLNSGQVRSDLEDRMLDLVNNERTSRGLEPLVMNQKAQAVARMHSQDMFAHGYFSHLTPEGQDPFERLHDGQVNFVTAGENIALAPNLTLAHNGLMNSPGHRANILDPGYKTVGIGIIDGGPYGLMITQDFTN